MNAIQTAVSDGTLTTVSVGIEYFEQADIAVLRSDSPSPLVAGTDYNWTSGTTLQLLTSVPVPNGVTITLRRTTENAAMLNVYDGGAPFTRGALDENFLQLLRLSQEFSEGLGLTGLRQSLDMHGNTIEGVGDPVFDDDAVNLGVMNDALSRVLRTPEIIALLPNAASRANRLLGFDGAGNPTMTVPNPGSAAALALDLADPGTGKGASMVGYNGGTVKDALDKTAAVLDSVAALRLFTRLSQRSAVTQGYYSPGDKGHGRYFADTADTTSVDNGGTVLVAVDNTRWKLLDTVPNLRQFGAKGDGVNSDQQALIRANGANPTSLVVPAGNYVLDANLTWQVPLVLLAGARITVPSVTLSIIDTFGAPVNQAFVCTGTGKVTFNASKVTRGFPEWWGAVTNDASKDCLPALKACELAVTITECQAADYWINSTWARTTNNRRVVGVSPFFTGAGAGQTRIVYNFPTGHAITMGVPGNVINNFVMGQTLENLRVVRAVALTAPAAGAELLGPTGVHIEGALSYKLDRVVSDEHYLGFYVGGTCQGRIDDCQASRSVPAANAGAGNDKFFGFVFDGLPAIGAAGGNASVFNRRCLSVCYNVPTSYGFFLQGSYVDTFFIEPESASCAYGMYLLGVGATAGTQVAGNVDIHITKPVFDAYTVAGLYVQNQSSYGTLDIQGGYAAPAIGTATASVVFDNAQGITKVFGFEHVGWPFPAVQGFLLQNSSGVTLDVTSQESLRPVILDACTLCTIRPSIKRQGAAAAVAAAVTLRNSSSRNFVQPTVGGKAGAFTTGVELLTATNTLNEINCSTINPTATTSGIKLVVNAAAVTTVGTGGNAGTNYASGVMA